MEYYRYGMLKPVCILIHFLVSSAASFFFAYLMHSLKLCKGNGMWVKKQFLLTIGRLKKFLLELYEFDSPLLLYIYNGDLMQQ